VSRSAGGFDRLVPLVSEIYAWFRTTLIKVICAWRDRWSFSNFQLLFDPLVGASSQASLPNAYYSDEEGTPDGPRAQVPMACRATDQRAGYSDIFTCAQPRSVMWAKSRIGSMT
jgi:hypothetical protein